LPRDRRPPCRCAPAADGESLAVPTEFGQGSAVREWRIGTDYHPDTLADSLRTGRHAVFDLRRRGAVLLSLGCRAARPGLGWHRRGAQLLHRAGRGLRLCPGARSPRLAMTDMETRSGAPGFILSRLEDWAR